MTEPTYKFAIAHVSFKPKWETDADPGDYPSNAGSAPRRSRVYVADITGSLIITCEPPCDDEDEWLAYVESIAEDVCPSVRVAEWTRFSEAIVGGRQTCVWVPREWEDAD